MKPPTYNPTPQVHREKHLLVPRGENNISSPAAEVLAMAPLVFGSARRASPRAETAKSSPPPLVFGADLSREPERAVASPARVRRWRDPDWGLVGQGMCPYCGARLKVSVVATRPVFSSADFGTGEIGVREQTGEEPALLRVECPACGRSWDVMRERRGVPVEEFKVLLQYAI